MLPPRDLFDDPARVIRQWPLQRLGLIPRRAHPYLALSVVRITTRGACQGEPRGLFA
jgi:hypothetical protein